MILKDIYNLCLIRLSMGKYLLSGVLPRVSTRLESTINCIKIVILIVRKEVERSKSAKKWQKIDKKSVSQIHPCKS